MANVHLSSIHNLKPNMIVLERINRAYNAVRERKVSLPIYAIERIWREAHTTEFFSDSDENVVLYIEAQMENGHERSRYHGDSYL